MAIKYIGLILLYMLQYALAMDSRNCSNSTGSMFVGTVDNPEMKFLLYTNKNYYEGQQIYNWNKTSLINSNFNESHPTRILVHGFKNNNFSCFNGFIKDAYLNKGNFNVFVIDWGDWSHNTDYIKVARSVFKGFGQLLGDFTIFLHKEGNISFDNMYLIGHSLGAQMSGAAGQYIKPNQYNTIFALDPAGPYFITANDDFMLSSDDAKYVEQISTNMGEFGYSGIIGHAAFYPNFGRIQKYCLIHDAKRLACSHSSAYWYFAESLNSKNQFCGQICPYYWTIILLRKCPLIKCDSTEKFLMGGDPSIPKLGTYYISVNYNPPFARCKCKLEDYQTYHPSSNEIVYNSYTPLFD